MFQSFDAATTPDQGPPRLAALRKHMEANGFDAVLVPRADRFGGEYVAPADARLEWLTGFTGSAGFAAVTPSECALFVDGRYTVQARAQCASEIAVVPWPKTELHEWLAGRPSLRVVAYDPWLHTVRQVERLAKALAGKGVALRPVSNPVDAIWPDRPAPPHAKAVPHPADLAGLKSGEKRARIAEDLRNAGHRAAIVTQPDSLCWLLNIRGADIPRVPVVHCMGVIHDDGRVDLDVDPLKVADLGPDPAIAVRPLADAARDLAGPVRIDPATCPRAVADLLDGAGIETAHGDDPCALPKARKTPAELDGARAAHLRDGAALCRFLAWLDRQGPGTFTEIDAVRALEGYRRDTNALRDISFDTIAGAGPHGAIVHYRVTEGTNRPVAPGLLLVDGGGQYLDGTTDVTRTVAVGAPPPEAIPLFTSVLRGMIAVSRARFPQGTAGRDLDPLARQHLRAEGRDFDHGTGHGVGSYLSVHEGPQRLSGLSETPLEPGMILSVEPGYYREGAFGIRIENLVVVAAAEAEEGREFMGFETLTLAPIDRRLIDAAALARDERLWLDAYHARVAAAVGPLLSGADGDWLRAAARPL